MKKKINELLKLGWKSSKGMFFCDEFYQYEKNGLYAILDDEGLSVEDDETVIDSLTIEELKKMSAKDIHKYVLKVMEG